MKTDFELSAHPLFKGISKEDLEPVLKLMNCEIKHYDRDEFIINAGDKFSRMGIVSSGSVMVMEEDYWGNRSIINKMETGDIFAEAFISAGVTTIPVSVMADTAADVILLDFNRAMKEVTSLEAVSCLMVNMVSILARKNIMLTGKMRHITKRTTKEKLLSYLSAQAKRTGSNSFKIPFNRQELADFLSVDRSALSSQLSSLKDEGLLKYHLNEFTLI